MIHSSGFSFKSNSLFFHCVRSSVHFFVLLGLLVHQFLFPSFSDPQLYIGVYSLCFFILAIDSVFLFFYHKKQKYLPMLLLFADALFLSALILVMGPLGLLIIFILAFVQFFTLSLWDDIFYPSLFLIYLSFLLPIALLIEGKFSFEDRIYLTALIHCVLLFVFFCGWLLHSFFEVFKNKETSQKSLFLDDWMNTQTSHPLALDLARKLKPVLNSLIKYFPENKDGREITSSHFVSIQKGRAQMEQLRNFIFDFIEYAEPELESLLENTVDIKKLLKETLKKLETHSQRPEKLHQTLQLPEKFEIQGSSAHLEKCFRHILINSFEALKNQNEPKIHIQGYLEKSWAVLSFLDNGHGIEEGDRKKLFNPLFSKRFGLRGLGLSYVKKIVKAHRADLSIESSDQGTEVIIRFPLIYNSSFFRFFKTSRTKAA